MNKPVVVFSEFDPTTLADRVSDFLEQNEDNYILHTIIGPVNETSRKGGIGSADGEWNTICFTAFLLHKRFSPVYSVETLN